MEYDLLVGAAWVLSLGVLGVRMWADGPLVSWEVTTSSFILRRVIAAMLTLCPFWVQGLALGLLLTCIAILSVVAAFGLLESTLHARDCDGLYDGTGAALHPTLLPAWHALVPPSAENVLQ